jgi:protein-S-isoprenylcysteine O-methyltransferase Ste14
LIPTIIVIQRSAILPEERRLSQQYGHEYEVYCQRVRRWL